MKYQIHPLAETYPPMSEAEMEALTADIAARGLQRTIVLYEGKILDGRNRYVACQKAGVEPAFVEYEGDDPLGQVNSLNLNRDLTAGQRAFVAARQWGLEGYSKAGRPTNGKSVKTLPISLDPLVKQHRTSKPSVIAARDILVEAPDLAMLVETCVRSLAFATEELEGRRDRARKQSQDAEKASRFSSEYRELISEGKTTPEEAMEEIFRREREERERLRVETEGRRIWFEGLEKTLKWIEEWVATRDDKYLAFYTREDLPGIDHRITRERIDECKLQLDRISTITLGAASHGSGNNRRSQGSPKNRQATS